MTGHFKELYLKDQEKNQDLTVKKGQEQDQTAKDKDENFTSVLKESTRKTRTNVAAVHSLNSECT